jgi:hypothetical protein
MKFEGSEMKFEDSDLKNSKDPRVRRGLWRRAAAPRRGGARLFHVPALGILALMLVLAQAVPASANEEESDEARMLVVQAVSLIANRAAPEDIVDRIRDALAAPDTSDVDLEQVEKSLALVSDAAEGDAAWQEARVLLEDSVGIRAASGYGPIPEPGEVGTDTPAYTAGSASGTTVVLDSLDPPRGVSDVGDTLLLVGSGIAILLGLYLARRWRPAHSTRELRKG